MAVYLAYSGMQNMFLTENPDFTHFKTLFSREMEYTTQVVEQTFDKAIAYRPGDTLIATLKQNGDYLKNISLKLILPNVTITNTNWQYIKNVPSIGDFVYGFSSNGTKLFTIQLNSRIPKTNSQLWYYKTGNVNFSFNSDTQKFVITSSPPSTISYFVFSNIKTAQLFGFVNNPIFLFSGLVRFNSSENQQVTLQECGWLPMSNVYNSYIDDISHKLINSVSLYIGNQHIQEFDSSVLKIKNDIDTTYKNRPVLTLLEGDQNIVDFNRVYYIELPFIQIPVYAIRRQDVSIHLKTNPLTNINFFASLVLSFDYFSDVNKLPRKYKIPLTQMQYFTTDNFDIRGPTKCMFTTGSNDFTFDVNGERFFDSEKAKIDSLDNFTNISRTSNVIVFDGPINMSRIRDQKWSSSNTNVYAETLNVLVIENDLAGLFFDYTHVKGGYKKYSMNALVQEPSPSPDTLYLFDYIPSTASNVNAMYSMRRVNVLYTGPIVRLKNVDTEEEDDFYTDETQSYLRNSSNISVDFWADGHDISVVRWYDQSGNNNFLYQNTNPPKLEMKDNIYVIFFDNAVQEFSYTSYWFLFTNTVSAQQCVAILQPAKFFEPSFAIESAESTIFCSKDTGTFLKLSNTATLSMNPSYFSYASNNVNNGDVNLNEWSTITTVYTNEPGQNIYFISDTPDHISQYAYNGYMFELGFFNGTTLTGSDRISYYNNRPDGF